MDMEDVVLTVRMPGDVVIIGDSDYCSAVKAAVTKVNPSATFHELDSPFSPGLSQMQSSPGAVIITREDSQALAFRAKAWDIPLIITSTTAPEQPAEVENTTTVNEGAFIHALGGTVLPNPPEEPAAPERFDTSGDPPIKPITLEQLAEALIDADAVLVVEDIGSLRTQLVDVLRQLNIPIHEAENLDEAETHIETGRVTGRTVVITDYDYPIIRSTLQGEGSQVRILHRKTRECSAFAVVSNGHLNLTGADAVDKAFLSCTVCIGPKDAFFDALRLKIESLLRGRSGTTSEGPDEGSRSRSRGRASSYSGLHGGFPGSRRRSAPHGVRPRPRRIIR